MREPPPQVDVDLLTTALVDHWDDGVVRVEHLPVGFGAHHWAAYDAHDEPRLFVTFDRLTPKRTAEALEAAYAGAAALRDESLGFVVAPVLTDAGLHTLPFADGALSCTPWLEGEAGGELDLTWTTDALRRLHSVDPPPLPHWRPLVGADLADTTAALTRRPWGPGPHADTARDAVRAHLDDLAAWTTRYHALAEVARGRTWVATHGEPHEDNQLLTPAAGSWSTGSRPSSPRRARPAHPRRRRRVARRGRRRSADARAVRPGVAARRGEPVRRVVRGPPHRHRGRPDRPRGAAPRADPAVTCATGGPVAGALAWAGYVDSTREPR